MIITLSNVLITAYCSCRLCCGASAHGRTASGQLPVEGVTCAAPRDIPFGSVVLFESKTLRVQDRLARRFDGRIDIYMASHAQAKRFGIKRANVVILVKEATKPQKNGAKK